MQIEISHTEVRSRDSCMSSATKDAAFKSSSPEEYLNCESGQRRSNFLPANQKESP
jgi:hypothetical protein